VTALRALIVPLIILGPSTRETIAADEAVALPQGVKAVWDSEKAFRETTPTRQRVCINGLWRWQPANPSDARPPTSHWGYFKVPAPWPGITDYMQKDAQTLYRHPAWKSTRSAEVRAAWYQREITIPETWKARHVAIELDLVNSLASVFIDEQPAGELRFPGGELDLSRFHLEPGTHRLSLLVVALPLQGVMLSYTDSASARKIEGSVSRRGLCGDVFLVASPAGERIDHVRVTTSVRRSSIEIGTTLEGLEPALSYTLHAEISRNGRALTWADSAPFTLHDLQDGRFSFQTNWKPDRLWDLHTPGHTQVLSLSLRDPRGATIDTFWDQRFGFREFEVQGRDFLLNGTRIQLCAVPLDNAQVSAGLSTYEAARESLERLKSFGINFVYTHNYGCEPGAHLSFADILRAADDVGILVALSQPHFSHYEWKSPNADRDNGYRRHATYYTRVAGNHPSVVFYAMSHNATGYAEDMNPDLFGTSEAPRDNWAMNNVKRAQQAETIVRSLDPSRIVYHHASGNLGVMHDTNFYPNFVPIQELSDWFETWSGSGVKPAFLCEYGAPFTWDWTMYRGWYKGERSFGSARVPWEFCLAEWNAQFLGDRAYDITDAEKTNLRWEARQFREGRLWHRWDYPYEVGSKVFDTRHEIIGRYLTDNFRAFRTWGVSAISPWEHDHFWRLRPGVSRERKNLTVDWEHLQRPGFSPDFIGPTYERMDLAFDRDDWEPTADALALLRNNRPLLGYIAGPSKHFTAKDHIYSPGEMFEKQLIVLNNSRQAVTCHVSWTMSLVTPIHGTREIKLGTGQQRHTPIQIQLPAGLAAGPFKLEARFAFDTGEVQADEFTIDVLPRPATLTSRDSRIALFDPRKETSALLDSLGVATTPIEATSELSNYDLLVIGRNALSLDAPFPRLDRVREGLRVIVFEQTAPVLEKRLGFRVQEYGLRQVFPRIPDHPLLNGISTEHLRDWRGEATLLPPRLTYEMRPMHGPTVRWCDIPVTRAWRCGNRGNVASVLIEKPARGDFLPILDGGFSLQYSPLMEYREGRGSILFCQLDVTSRTEIDPAATTLVCNLLEYSLKSGLRPGRLPVLYAGETPGLDHLHSAGIQASRWTKGDLPPNTILVVGPGGSAALTDEKPDLTRWLANDGRLLAIGLDENELASLLDHPPRIRLAEHIAAFFEPPSSRSAFAGLGPADVHCRDPRSLPLIQHDAEMTGNGLLATLPGKRIVLCQLVPWRFNDLSRPNVKRTYRRVSFLLSRVLANLGSAGTTPLLERFSSPVSSSNLKPRYKTGHYLDEPEEWDDPYRFFRW
jgi:hypothetical protein